MDVKTYYQRIRNVEATIPTQFAIVMSLSTDDGGKHGLMIEVPRYLAAKMVVEGSAQLAMPEQVAEFHEGQQTAFQAAKEAEVVSKLEVTMLPSEELKRLTEDVRKLKSGAKAGKD